MGLIHHATKGGEAVESKEQPYKNDNVVILPQTLEKWMLAAQQAAQNKNYEEAIHQYEQILRHDPNQSAAQMGLAVTLLESQRFSEAVDRSGDWLNQHPTDESMIRVHLAGLLQTERWGALVRYIEEVFQQKGLTTLLRQELESVLDACRPMTGNEEPEENQESQEQVWRRRIQEQPQLIKQWISDLHTDEVEKQLQALERLAFASDPWAEKSLEEWLSLSGGDPMMKTMGLRTLAKMGKTDEVLFTKKGKSYTVRPTDLPLHTDEFPAHLRNVLEQVQELAEHEDLSLSQFAKDIWMSYLYRTFPDWPGPAVENIRAWSAALHYTTAQRLYGEADIYDISDRYAVDLDALKPIIEKLEL
jgi:tetratricopeptide (TPR) repeat protein